MAPVTQSRIWPEADLRTVRAAGTALVVVLDPDGLIPTRLLNPIGEVRRAESDWDLWRVFEAEGRGRSTSGDRLVMHVVASNLREASDLPYPIEQEATVARIRWPFGPRWLTVWRDLDEPQNATLVGLLSERPKPSVADVVARLFGVLLPQTDPAAELEAVVRLWTRHAVPASLWPDVRTLLRGDLGRAAASDPPATDILQAGWDDWMTRGSASPSAPFFATAPGAALTLLDRGVLHAAERVAVGLPEWTAAGSLDVAPATLIEGLLMRRPDPWPPLDFEGWVQLGAWWGDVRASMAAGAPLIPDLVARCWSVWAEIDTEFAPWLKANLGPLMARSRRRPATVDKIAPFLARRLRSGTERVALIVMDGMGFAQWSLIQRACGLTVLDAGGSAAMIPTLTSFSRQAIFAGTTPLGFADSVMTTAREHERWRSFWTTEGLVERDVRYENLPGATRDQIPTLGSERVIGLAVLAVDEMMHGAELLGDVQVAASIRAWALHGFMRTLVERATAAGFEVWVTADHGNLEALPTGKVNEGLLVEHAGRRARSYPNSIARDAAKADGIAWDPPGLPETAPSFLFAPGRTGYISRSAQVIHGSLSLDEVIVPFVRVGS
jgi:PglZ domain